MVVTIDEIDTKEKRVLLRVDYNVPMDGGVITDDTRIRNTLPTLKKLLLSKAKIILLTHVGRPKGKKDPALSAAPTAKRLSELLSLDVKVAPDCIGEKVQEMVGAMECGDILMLENLRFHPGEEHPDAEPGFTDSLAKLGDVYINDAFGAAHRKHASTYYLPHFFKNHCAMGYLMQREVEMLLPLVENPKRPFFGIIGGAKVGSKIGVIESLLEKCDKLFIGGGMIFTFFKAQGLEIGASILDMENIDVAKKLISPKLILPVDVVATKDGEIKVFDAEAIEEGWAGMDVGPETLKIWQKQLMGGETIFWNGPLGVFEKKPFDEGTNFIAEVLSHLDATTIIGGGDSVAAVTMAGLSDQMTHLSTGGGASLELIEKGSLPGIDVLKNT